MQLCSSGSVGIKETFLAEICVTCRAFLFFPFSQRKCDLSASPAPVMPLGHRQPLTRRAVVLYVQGQRPVANVVICYGTLSSAVDSIVDMPGCHVCSRDRHYGVVAARGESLAPCVMLLLMCNQL